MEAQFGGVTSRRNKVRSAERAQEVVERFFVGQVDHRKAKAPLVTVAAEQIVMAKGEIEQVARRNPRRVLVVIFRAIGWYADSRGSRVGRTGAAASGGVAQRRRERRKNPLAARTGTEQPNRRLLVSVE